MQPSLEPQSAPKRGFPVALMIGAGLVLILVSALWFFSSTGSSDSAPPPLPFGPEEQAYAPRIRFHDFKLSRAENLLGQEVTFIECTIENIGSGIIREIEVELGFYNLDNQLVHQEKRRLLGRFVPPLGGGRFRQVDMNFEKLPPDWNQHAPQIRVTGLVFEP